MFDKTLEWFLSSRHENKRVSPHDVNPGGYEFFRILKKGTLTSHFKCFAPRQFRTRWDLDKKT